MTLNGKTILVLGGSSGMGFGVAEAAQTQGANVTIASRSQAKIEAALARLGGAAMGVPPDTGDTTALERFFADRSPFDHGFCSPARTKVSAVRELALEDAYGSFDSKF